MENKSDTADASRYLCFSLGDEKFAMPLLQVKEVIANSPTTSVPQSPPYFKGFLNLRGQVISVIDLRSKLKVGKPDILPETTIVILDLEELSIGVMVDSVNSVSSFEPSVISEPPIHDTATKNEYIIGVARHEKDLILLVDLKKVLSVDEVRALKNKNSKIAA